MMSSRMHSEPTRVRSRRRRVLVFCAVSAVAYVAAYAAVRVARPRPLLARDKTPGPLFCGLFQPLRFLEAGKPDWYWRSVPEGLWITAKVEENNLGNGRLYFEWEGRPRRAFYARALDGIREGDTVRMRLSYEVESWDDFSSHLVETIEEVRKLPSVARQ